MSPETPAKVRTDGYISDTMFSEKKYKEVIEKSREKKRYSIEIEEEEGNAPLGTNGEISLS